MKNLTFLSDHTQTRQWMKVLHELDVQAEDLCYLEHRGQPEFAARLLGRITGMANRFQDTPQLALRNLQRRATVLWAKNRFQGEAQILPTQTQVDVTMDKPEGIDMAGIVILPKSRLH